MGDRDDGILSAVISCWWVVMGGQVAMAAF